MLNERLVALLMRASGEAWGIDEAALTTRSFSARIVRADEDDEDRRDVPTGPSALGMEKGGGRRLFQQVGSVAIVDVWGVLDKQDADVEDHYGRYGTSYESIDAAVRAARLDDTVKSILLRIDSPGGAAMPAESAADLLMAGRGGAGGKPVYAYADDMAASAALYLGAQADKFLLSPGGWVGSIGTIMMAADISGALEKYGIRVNTIKSTASKDTGSPYRPMSEEDRARLQREVNAYDALFVKAVARGRGVSEDKVREWQSARGYIGQQAVASGLADGVRGSVLDVIAEMESAFGGRGGTANGGGRGVGQAGKGRAAAQEHVGPAGATGMTPEEIAARAGTAQGTTAGGTNGTTAGVNAGAGGGGGGDGVAGRIDPATAARIGADAVAADQKRREGIRSRAAAFKGNAKIEALALKCDGEAGTTPEQFSDQAVAILCAENGPTRHVAETGVNSSVSVGVEEREKRVDALSTAVVMRYNGAIAASIDRGGEVGDRMAAGMGYENADGARRAFRQVRTSGLQSMRIADVAAQCVASAAGISLSKAMQMMQSDAGMFMNVLFNRWGGRVGAFSGHSSSDFPLLMAAVANKTLMPRFLEIATIWQRIARRGTASDYKERKLLSSSSLGGFQELPEGMTPRHVSFNERQEAILVEAQGLRFGLTYQAMRNDDLGVFNQRLELIAAAARRVPDALLIALIQLNSGAGPTLSDGNPICHASRSNVGAGAALSYSALRTDFTNYTTRRDFGPDTPFIEVDPKIILVPKALELQTRDLMGQEFIPGTDASPTAFTQRNMLRGMFEVVATPKITGTRRWLFADPNTVPAYEVAFLDGSDTPQVVEIDSRDPMAMEWQATILGVGVAGVQPEGVYTDAGQ